MNITLIIIVVEILIVLSAVVGILFYTNWKTQKIKAVEFEGLLTTFENQVEERKAQLILMLKESYEMEAEGAEESASYMIEAEKQFLQEFLKQQIEKTPVNDFYLHLREFLDQYLYFVPKLNNEHENNIQQTQAEESVEDDALEKDIEEEELTENSTDEVNTPDSENEESENTTESDEKNAESNEVESEPDWGDAFSESGDEVDKDAEAAFEADKNKD